jgi:hypothetical protein
MAGTYTDPPRRFYPATGMRLGQQFRLGSFWDDVYKVGGTVASIAKQVQQASQVGQQVQAGNAQVTVVPTKQGIVNYASDAASSNTGKMALVLGGLGIAAVLLSRHGSSPRRYRRR